MRFTAVRQFQLHFLKSGFARRTPLESSISRQTRKSAWQKGCQAGNVDLSLECPMTPKTFAQQMRQARLKSPLLKREQALKQFAEVEAFLQRHNLQQSERPSVGGLKARGA